MPSEPAADPKEALIGFEPRTPEAQKPLKRSNTLKEGFINALHVCGLNEGVKFEFPDPRKPNHKELSERTLTELQCNVGFAVYSLKMIFNDGESPQYGSDQLTGKYILEPNEVVTRIKIRAT